MEHVDAFTRNTTPILEWNNNTKRDEIIKTVKPLVENSKENTLLKNGILYKFQNGRINW